MSKFRMWYIPQVPMDDPFIREYDTAADAEAALDLISVYSYYEYLNRVKPDYADAGGVEQWDEDADEWWAYEPEADL